MTPKQIERTKKKIAGIKRALAAERRMFGGYMDSRGLRYMPPKLFIQLEDFKGGLTYLRWFNKNFSDDIGFPDFLFGQTLILFKCGKLKDAAPMAFRTFCSNPYLFDKFFGKPIMPADIWHGSNAMEPEYLQRLDYASTQPALTDFSEWLEKVTSSAVFQERATKVLEVYKKLNAETDHEMRYYLLLQVRQLEKSS